MKGLLLAAGLFLSFGLAALPDSLGAQAVKGHLVDSETRRAVINGSVALRDSLGVVVARAGTDEDGAFMLKAPEHGCLSIPGTMRGPRRTGSSGRPHWVVGRGSNWPDCRAHHAPRSCSPPPREDRSTAGRLRAVGGGAPMSPARRKVDLDAVAERCQALKLMHVAECLPELVEEASREDLSPVKFFDRVLEREIERKNERRIVTSLRLSGLPVGKTFEGFDWTFQPRADRSKIEALATCAFVRQTENVLFMGPPGVGKSHLAVALAVKAIKNGFSATHFLLDDLMHVLKGDAAIPPRRLKAKRYLNSSLLVIDEVGFRPLDRQEANLFFRLVSARYEKGSIILTSNKHVRDWPEIFADDEILTTAILDRLLHHVHIVHIDGRSYRLRELDGLLKQPASDAPAKGGDTKTT